MNEKGILIVISGFSGAGKGTLVGRMLEEYDNYSLSISATSRGPRVGEVDGKHYFFKTREEFEKLIENDGFIEYATYVGNYYGTPKQFVLEQMELGKDVILEIEIQGALKIKEQFPDALLLFVTPPSAEELKRRLVTRGTEDIDTINKRLARAFEESEGMENYDYLVINDDLEECVKNTHQIIQNEHVRASRNLTKINEIRAELKAFGKENK